MTRATPQRIDLSQPIHLPSGRTVQLHLGAPPGRRSSVPLHPFATTPQEAASPEEAPFARALSALARPGALTGTSNQPLDVYTFTLRDLHTLRALLTCAGHLSEEPAAFTCQNCDAPFSVAPSTLLAPAPFFDGELTDPEYDEPFPFGEPQPIPRIALPPGRFGRPPRLGRTRRSFRKRGDAPHGGTTITFAERTAHEALPLLNAADDWITFKSKETRITPALVIAMGIIALGNEKSPRVIAEALSNANEIAWGAVLEHYLHAAYPPRLFGLYRCSHCDARNDLDVPLAREWDRTRRMLRSRNRPPFPDLDTFEARVRFHADRVYKAQAVRNIDLFVDADVPDCDEGGEPLLGSYVPFGTDETIGIQKNAEVRLYYRTFKSAYDEDPSFDVEAEIFETIAHEIEHHLNYLRGDDPMDDEEHATIDAEVVRRIGSKETARRNAFTFTNDLVGFFKTTWPLWLGVLLFALLARYMS